MKYLDKIIEYGLYFLVFLLPIQTRWIIKAGEINGGYSEYATYSLYATDILLILLLLLFVVRQISSPALVIAGESLPPGLSAGRRKGFFGDSKTVWRISGGLILASAVSVFFALDKLLALYKLGWLILGVSLFWLITRANYSRLKLIYAMLTGVFLQAILGIWQFLTQSSFANKWLGMALHNAAGLGTSVVEAVGADGVGERWLRAYGGLDHPNVFGGAMAAGILLLIGQIIKAEKAKNLEIINWVFLAIFSAGLFFSFSRSAWLGLVIGSAVIMVLAIIGRNLKLQKNLAEIILVMGILVFILFSQYQNLVISRLAGGGRLEVKSTSERLTSYQESWQMIKNNWLIGVGSGNYSLVLNEKINSKEANYYYQPVHNVFLLVWAEVGIIGLLFFLGLIIYLLILNFKISRTGKVNNKKVGPAILAGLIVIIFFDHWLFSLHFGVLFFWLVLGAIADDKEDKRLLAD